MNGNIACPCGSGNSYESCCSLFVSLKIFPKTALELMKSRYCAFYFKEIDYLIETLHPDKRYKNLATELMESINNTNYTSLDIVSTFQGGEGDKVGKVKFIATYEYKGKQYMHKEESRFKKYKNIWYYIDGKVDGEVE